MLRINIPGMGELVFEHLLLDYNGTLGCDGELLPGVSERLQLLAGELSVHIITADTYGDVARRVADLPVELAIIPQAEQDQAKLAYLEQLGATQTVAIGNGRNDQLILSGAGLGLAVIQQEGTALAALQSADIVVPDACAALDLLLKPKRLIATLRN